MNLQMKNPATLAACGAPNADLAGDPIASDYRSLEGETQLFLCAGRILVADINFIFLSLRHHMIGLRSAQLLLAERLAACFDLESDE